MFLVLLALLASTPSASDSSAAASSSGGPAQAFPPGSNPSLPGLVDVGAKLQIRVDLKYASSDNFMKRDVYGGLKRCFLVGDAAQKLASAHELLKERAPSLTFVVYDCARPRRVQLVMWNVVKGTPQQEYVANPHQPPGSVHNHGCAVDLSLWDSAKGSAVDMGTPYDFFGRAAHPEHEVSLWREGALSGEQLANRLLLREVMLRAGFRILPNEWWHFDCAPGEIARKRYPVVD